MGGQRSEGKLNIAHMMHIKIFSSIPESGLDKVVSRRTKSLGKVIQPANGGKQKDAEVRPGSLFLYLTKIGTHKFLQVKRIIGQRDARLKKNQDKAVIESKRKSKDELVREMSVSALFTRIVLV